MQADSKTEKLFADEKGIKIMLEKIRRYFYKRNLVGSVDITRSYISAEASLSVEIDGSGDYTGESIKDTRKMGIKVNKTVDAVMERFIGLVVKGTQQALEQLIYRSKTYYGKSYKDDMTLSASLTFTDPTGYFGVTIGIAATVQSMHESIFRDNEFEMTFAFPSEAIK
eukprot:CAMPEP_0174955720 /NCGR_PEP_ID=MMETSP0004_2-20121128/1139_1 /TAXON_ID=420556 /ORGANISM="Ochromonas sp., Strain CCMP1393" /LENGTH=167 /DNA_ID=CAMNT_0016203681 /DNA_START=26 /DNA_END=529 /DNA_ORIENTATION=-